MSDSSQMKYVHNLLEKSTLRFPEKPALFANSLWHTYSEINTQANRIAHMLRELGIGGGDRVALFIENSFEYVATYYAILKAGAITVALNTDSSTEDVAYIIKDCGVSLLITQQRLLRKVQPLFLKNDTGITSEAFIPKVLVWSKKNPIELPDAKMEFLSLPEAAASFSAENPGLELNDKDPASIVYTSGSTSKPRGATLSHFNILSNTRSIVAYLELMPEDRIMVVLPFYYIYGKSLLNTHFSVGGSVVVDNRFLYPNVVLKTMLEQESTGFSGVPSTFTILLNRSNLKKMTFPALRYITQAGGAMAPAVQKEVAETFAPAKVFIMYGATEASARLSYLDPSDLPRKWGSIGKAIPDVELFVADQDGNALEIGEEGEIVARGANIMSGYWNHPEETEKVLRNGLYWTGDLGMMDEEGFIFVVGRKKDMIKIGGIRVSAKEIEEALYEHPQVSEAAVIGVEDDLMGEVPKAFVALTDESDPDIEETLNTFLKSRLSIYKLPKVYEIRKSLPKNQSGKIQKLQLK